MKVLFAIDCPENQLNPYVFTLINGLKKIDTNIVCDWGISKFWSNNAENFDIIHIMWPELLLKNTIKTSTDLQNRLIELKEKGVKIVSTCHNLIPHYNNNASQIEAYKIVYEMSDQIYHLGNYSLNLFNKTYKNNLLLYHHIYDDRYQHVPSKQEAVKKLHLDTDKKYILCFGKFRNKEERNLIIELNKTLYAKGIRFLAPSFYLVTKRRNFILFIWNIINYLYFKFKYPQIKMHFLPVPDKDLTYYFSACDIVFIQRKKILNSGNLPLAFYLKKVVVGPNIGNVGSILNESGNPTFNIDDEKSILNAIEYGIDFSLKNDKGLENYQLCLQKFTSESVCKQLYKYYQILCC